MPVHSCLLAWILLRIQTVQGLIPASWCFIFQHLYLVNLLDKSEGLEGNTKRERQRPFTASRLGRLQQPGPCWRRANSQDTVRVLPVGGRGRGTRAGTRCLSGGHEQGAASETGRAAAWHPGRLLHSLHHGTSPVPPTPAPSS